MNKRILPIVVPRGTTIKEAMQKMQASPHANPPGPAGIVVVAGKNNKLIGVVTDGDIRRALLKGMDSTMPVSAIMSRNPVHVRGEQTAGEMLSEVYAEIRKRNAPLNKYHNIVVTDRTGMVLDIVTPFELWRRGEVKAKTAVIMGLGYVGLTLALTLNEFGIEVRGIEVSDEVLNKLKRGMPHFYEQGLETLLKKHINKLLFLKKELGESESDIYIICVSTPVDERGRIISLYLKKAAEQVGRVLKPHDLVILRSTVPVGTTRGLVIPVLEKKSRLKAGEDFFVAFAPERTVEGRALEELKILPQIIGGYNKQSVDYTSQVFQLFARSLIPVSSLEAAEAVKLFNNTFRDVIFAFSNEAAQMCASLGLSAQEVIRAANEGYPRDKIPGPSPGVGGACLVKDPYIFVESAKRAGMKAKFPHLARLINKSMIDFVCKKVDEFCRAQSKDINKTRIFVMGIAFKGEPETSDMRDSASVDIIKKLKAKYQNLSIYDPVAHKEDLEKLGAAVVSSPRIGFRGADCALILNNHLSYRNLDIYSLAKSMKRPAFVFDGWGIYRREELASLKNVSYAGL